jgi:pyochelin biosynthesis protein PchC
MTSPTADDDKWTRRFHRSEDSSIVLVCFPHAGGSASYYFTMSQALAPSIEVLAVQYPGRQDRRREAFIDNIPALADHIFDALSPLSNYPFAFFGHSMGAILSFEVANRFEQRTETGPQWIFASGRRAPSRYRIGDVHLRGDAGLLAELRVSGGTQSRVLDDPELVAMILPAIRNDYKAIEKYVYAPGPPLCCPITALVGDSDPQTSIEDAFAWKEHSTGDFDFRVFPGGHFYLEAYQAEVNDAILAALYDVPATSCADGVHSAI